MCYIQSRSAMPSLGLLICAGASSLFGGMETMAAEKYVNGYTYIAPSYYLTPPVVVTGPYYPAPYDPVPYFPARVPVAPYYPPPLPPAPYGAAVIPSPIYPAPVYSTPGGTQAPAVVPPSPVLSYEAVGPSPYRGLPGSSYRERVIQRPREVEYQVKTYSPAGRPQARYEVEYDRRGVEIKTRQRR